jgi:tetratricopeptide (TPR) repeat protein
VFNVAIHFFATLLLYAIVRRTLLLPYFAKQFDASAGWLALAVALVWSLHPLQTEAVIYATQRSELLMALSYLATLYCSLRYWSSNNLPTQRATWLSLAVFASLAGMASKEVMVSAPVMVLLFDRTFISGTLRSAFRRSWPLYVGLACTWLLLIALNVDSPRGKSAGFGLGPPLSSWWMTQSQVLLLYLKLVVWPAPLLIHYRLAYLETMSQAWVYVIPVVALLVLTIALLWRNNPVGYLLTWLLAILSPTSLVPILTEVAAERRMYLPLASLVVLMTVGGYFTMQNRLNRPVKFESLARAAIFALVIALGLISANRLRAYENPVILWRDVAQHQPQNALAHGSLGELYAKSGRLPEALKELELAVSLDPNDLGVLVNLGQVLADSGRFNEAIDKLQAAIAREPDQPLALNNLGVALIHSGRIPEAIDQLERAVRSRPTFAMARNNLGAALASVGRNAEARVQFQEALRLNPSLVQAQYNLDALMPPRAQATEPAR